MSRSKGNPASTEAPVNPPEPIGGLTPVELHALAILGKEAKEWRDSLSPGVHQVDVMLRLEATLVVGEDQSRVNSSLPGLEEVLAFVFGQLGEKTRDKVRSALTAFAASNNVPAPPKPKPELLAMATGAVDLMRRRVSKTVRGSVSAHPLVVTRLPGRAA